MHFKTMLALGAALSLTMSPVAAQAQSADANARLADEGFNRSRVQQTAHELLDEIGPRLTNSTNMRKAEAWAVEKMRELGLANVRKEGFEFGRGWEMISSDVQMTGPRALKLTATPVAWTPGTNGPVEADVIVAPMREVEHFEAYRGKLRGKIVLVSLPGMGDEPARAPFSRLDRSEISDRDKVDLPDYDPLAVERRLQRPDFWMELDAFMQAEGALAWVKRSYRDGKLLHGTGYTHHVGRSPLTPGIEMAAEDYRRVARLAKSGTAPRLRVDSNVQFVDGDTQAYNIIGEIKGSDPSAGYVMAGAHFDSWAAADGAVDNGAGVVTVLEAARLLLAQGGKPKRTIKFALWGAEEQGLWGSRAYVRQHLVSRAGEAGLDTYELNRQWRYLFPITKKPGYSQMKAYFNMDNGSGKFRGIHAEENPAVVPLLRKWLSPFSDLDASTVVAGSTGGTDHVYFQAVGLPGFQFIQDPLDYFARLHHTNVDTFDHLRPDDLRQTSVVMAGVLLASANDDKTLPTKILPQSPEATNPFAYSYPED